MIKTEAYNESKQFLGLTKKNGVKASKLYTQKPLGFFSVTRNLPAYRTNQEGVLELMGANVPRIDYPITILEPARTNLLLRSQEFDNANWSKFNSSVTSNLIQAPDGTMTADKFIASAVNANHTIFQSITNLATNWTFSIFAKKAEYDRLLLFVNNTNFVGFNLNTGIIESTLGTGITNANIQNTGNGWYRCSITSTSTQTGPLVAVSLFNGPYLNGNSNPTFLGNNINGIYIWGAQLETGNTATAYIPTTNAPVTVPDVIEAGCPELLVENEATNRVIFSNDFANANWVKNNLTNSSGLLTTTATNTSIFIAQNSIGGFVANNKYVFSIYAKKGNANFIQLLISGGQTIGNANANFDLNNGTYQLNSGISASMEYVDGYYRCSLYYESSVTGSNDPIIWLVDSLSATRAANFTGAIGSNLSIRFVQQELSTNGKATSYIPTTTTAVTRPADNVRNNTLGYDNEKSTIFVRARLNFTTDYQGIATLWDGNDIDNGYITMYYYISGGVRYIAFDTYNGPDTNQYLYTAPSDGVYSIAFAYHTGKRTYRIAINGVLITDDKFSYDLPSYTLLTQMMLGSFFTYFNSRTKGFMYFDSMLDNDSLENLTVQ